MARPLTPPSAVQPDEATLKRLIRKGTLAMDYFPMLCGSAFKNKGVQPMLDAVVDYMPAPTDVDAINVRPASRAVLLWSLCYSLWWAVPVREFDEAAGSVRFLSTCEHNDGVHW